MTEGFLPRVKQQRNVALARKLRSQMSLPEVLLWQRLRQCKDVKFRRQHPVGNYVLDFYCPSAHTCIEIDGISHNMGGKPQRDTLRDAWLKDQGIKVIRIPAADVLQSADDVADAILCACHLLPDHTMAQTVFHSR
jgi:very-short-patch-repair endonuclease